LSRPGLARRYGDGVLECGFRFIFSQQQLAGGGSEEVRFFALSNKGIASELRYRGSFS